MMNFVKYFILIILEVFLLSIMILLGIKIKNLHDRQVKGVQVVTVMRKKDQVFDSASGLKYFYEPKPNNTEVWNPKWLGREVKNTINSDSRNERFEYSSYKPIGVYRIISIGDSFTFGQYVNTSENYPEVLEDMLNSKLKCKNISKFEVINLGVYGYDMEYTVERFTKRGIKYSPDLVIWLLNNEKFGKVNEYIMPYNNSLTRQGLFNGDITKLNQAYIELANLGVELTKKLGYDSILQYQKNQLNKFYDLYQGKLLILGFLNLSEGNKNIIKEFIKKNNNYLFYSGVFNTTSNSNYSIPDGHPSKEGYKKIVEDILAYLTKNILPDCQ